MKQQVRNGMDTQVPKSFGNAGADTPDLGQGIRLLGCLYFSGYLGRGIQIGSTGKFYYLIVHIPGWWLKRNRMELGKSVGREPPAHIACFISRC